MKRRIVAVFVFALAFGLLGIPLAADNSTYYPVRLDVVKVFSHADGFRVMYRRGALSTADFYAPITWFVPGGKAEMIKGRDTSYPYAIVYYKDGKFSHLKLYVLSNYRDPSWGQLEPEEGKGRFDIQEPAIQY